MSAAGYRDAARPVEERVEDLLGRMTLEEKVAQLTGILPFDLLGPAGLNKQLIEQHLSDGLGEVSAGGLLSPDPANLIPALNQIQRFLVERTRLGIPAIVHHEALAGLVHPACQRLPDRDHPRGVVGPGLGRSHERRRPAPDAGPRDPPGVLTEPRHRS